MEIADVMLVGSNQLVVLDENGDKISHYFLSWGQELVGFSSDIIVLKNDGGRVTIYDSDFEEVSHRFLIAEEVKNVVGEKVITQRGDRVITYDLNFEEVSYRFL